MWMQTEASLFVTTGREAFVAARARRVALVARMMPASQEQGDLDVAKNLVCLFRDALAQLGDVKDEWGILLLFNTCECLVKECRHSDSGGTGNRHDKREKNKSLTRSEIYAEVPERVCSDVDSSGSKET